MSMPEVQEVLKSAMSLPLVDRIAVAERLEESILEAIPHQVAETDGTTDAEFLAELERRMAEYLNDRSVGIPGHEVIAEMRRRQAAGL
jgi:putative addiction module component (TIGR02574 family)